MTELIKMMSPNIASNYINYVWLSVHVVLATKNVDDCNEINFQIQNKIAGEWITFRSVNSIFNQDDISNPTEFLNTTELVRLPLHNLQLNVRSVIIMLRYINQLCFCKGSRLAVEVLIPRILMIPNNMTFDVKRLQCGLHLQCR